MSEDSEYMTASANLYGALSEYVKAAGAIGKNNQEIGEDISDALCDAGIKNVVTTE